MQRLHIEMIYFFTAKLILPDYSYTIFHSQQLFSFPWAFNNYKLRKTMNTFHE